MRMSKHSLMAFTMLLISACGGDDDGISCTTEAVSNFSITILDNATSARICDATVEAKNSATGATATLDPVASGSSCGYSGGVYESPGTFTITAGKTGYMNTGQSGVIVAKGVCHVTPVALTLRLAN